MREDRKGWRKSNGGWVPIYSFRNINDMEKGPWKQEEGTVKEGE